MPFVLKTAPVRLTFTAAVEIAIPSARCSEIVGTRVTFGLAGEMVWTNPAVTVIAIGRKLEPKVASVAA